MATWYVAPTGTTTTQAGTRDNPFLCSAINWTPIAAGDTVYLRTAFGNYNETLTIGKSGSAGSYITIDSDPLDGGKAVIDAQSTRTRCIDHSAKTYIRIKNITGKNSTVANGAVCQPGTNWEVFNLSAENCVYSMNCYQSSNLLVDGLSAIGCEYSLALNAITGAVTVKNMSGASSVSYPTMRNRLLITFTASNTVILENIILDGAGSINGGYHGLFCLYQGVFAAGSYMKNIEVKNGVAEGFYITNATGSLLLEKLNIHDNALSGIYFSTNSTGITFQDSQVCNNHNDGVYWGEGSHDIVCKRVLSYNNGLNPAYDLATGGDGFTCHAGNYNINISYCAAFKNRNTGFAMIQDSAGSIVHCTSAYNGDSAVPTVRGGFYFDLSGVNPTSGTSWTIKNSISYKDSPRNVFLSTAGKSIVTFDYNSYKPLDDATFATIDGGSTNISWTTYKATYEANSKNEDSKVAVSGMLASGSPCVDAAPWMSGINDGGQSDPWGKKVYGLPNTGADQGAGMPYGGRLAPTFGTYIR